MKVRYRGVLYDSIQAAAAAWNLNPVDLHKEFVQASKTGERWYTGEGDGYEDVPDTTKNK